MENKKMIGYIRISSREQNEDRQRMSGRAFGKDRQKARLGTR